MARMRDHLLSIYWLNICQVRYRVYCEEGKHGRRFASKPQYLKLKSAIKGGSMNALELLKEDHEKVAALFDQVKETEDEQKHWSLFEQIKTELEVHTHIEETVFYPRLQQYEDLKDMVLEALEEHKQVKTLIREIAALAKGSEKLAAKLTVMGENVEHHVEEEEDEMFPQVEDLLSEDELEELGTQLQAAKKDRLAAIAKAR
jgi:hemerythrin superfamily protein